MNCEAIRTRQPNLLRLQESGRGEPETGTLG